MLNETSKIIIDSRENLSLIERKQDESSFFENI